MAEHRTEDERCAGCGHSLSWHFRDVNGVARCTVIHSGVSDRGIIGIPWSKRCACADFVLPPRPPSRREELINAQSKRLREIVRSAFDKTQKVPDDDSTKPEV